MREFRLVTIGSQSLPSFIKVNGKFQRSTHQSKRSKQFRRVALRCPPAQRVHAVVATLDVRHNTSHQKAPRKRFAINNHTQRTRAPQLMLDCSSQSWSTAQHTTAHSTFLNNSQPTMFSKHGETTFWNNTVEAQSLLVSVPRCVSALSQCVCISEFSIYSSLFKKSPQHRSRKPYYVHSPSNS